MSSLVRVVGSIVILAQLSSMAQAQLAKVGPISDRAKKSEADALIKVFAFQHADANEMLRIVSDLFEHRAQRGGFGVPSQPRLRMSFDARTNSLIVIGPGEDLEVIEALVMQLDSPTEKRKPRTDELERLRKRVEVLERQLAEVGAAVGKGAARTRVAPSATSSNRLKAPFQSIRSSQGISKPITVKPTLRQPAPTPGVAIRVDLLNLKGAEFKLKSIVANGALVKEGDLIVAIESADLEESIKSQQVEVQQKRAQLKQSEGRIEDAAVQRASAVAKARLELEMAKINLLEFQKGTQPLQTKVLQAEVSGLERKLKLAQGRAKAGLEDDSSVDGLRDELDVAKSKLRTFQEFTAPKMLKELQYSVAAAEQRLEQVERAGASGLDRAKLALQANHVELEYAQNKLARFEKDLKACQIFAPAGGRVVNYGLSQGSLVRPRQTVLTLVPSKKKSDSKKDDSPKKNDSKKSESSKK